MSTGSQDGLDGQTESVEQRQLDALRALKGAGFLCLLPGNALVLFGLYGALAWDYFAFPPFINGVLTALVAISVTLVFQGSIRTHAYWEFAVGSVLLISLVVVVSPATVLDDLPYSDEWLILFAFPNIGLGILALWHSRRQASRTTMV